jgi:hypothetical protein
VFVAVRYSEEDARKAIASATNWAEALRLLGMRDAGGNHKTLQKYAALWEISTEHFDPSIARRRVVRGRIKPLDEILVEASTFHRGHLKARLYREGLKVPACELCGQGESWRGKQMSLVLDHINGDPRDNRLENLRIACPNCAATFDTHCGKNFKRKYEDRACEHCRAVFAPRYPTHRFCSPQCGAHSPRRACYRPELRKVERPPYEQLRHEIESTSYLAVGRKYGVSDNAIRKWVRAYERVLADASSVVEAPPVDEAPPLAEAA